MTNEQSIDDTESLRSALQAILEEAATNDVEIEGSLRIQSTTDHPNWEIQVWKLE
jgi:hypothetical protein